MAEFASSPGLDPQHRPSPVAASLGSARLAFGLGLLGGLVSAGAVAVTCLPSHGLHPQKGTNFVGAAGPAHLPARPGAGPADSVLRAGAVSPQHGRRRPHQTLVSAAPPPGPGSAPLRGMEAQPPRPNDNTYWVTPGLIAGEYPGAPSGPDATREKLRRYLDRGITYFVDLTFEGEKASYEGILREEARAKGMEDSVGYVRLPIPDFGVPEDRRRMRDILDAIDSANERGHSVYVHCRGGIGRTGTTVGCYLVRHGSDGSAALREVNRLFQNSRRSLQSYRSPETDEQEAFVRSWQG